MKHPKIIIGAVAATAAIITTVGVVGATSGIPGDDNDVPITGDDLVRASEAALAHTGEGVVSETEVGDEDSYYEVEVTLDSGRQVDVQLDENFQVVAQHDDNESASDEG